MSPRFPEVVLACGEPDLEHRDTNLVRLEVNLLNWCKVRASMARRLPSDYLFCIAGETYFPKSITATFPAP
jgi:hypothetical protein